MYYVNRPEICFVLTFHNTVQQHRPSCVCVIFCRFYSNLIIICPQILMKYCHVLGFCVTNITGSDSMTGFVGRILYSYYRL
jgi:hypothetical protein